jgi:hypothetical protein
MKHYLLLLLLLVLHGTCVRAQLFRGGNGNGGANASFTGQPALPLTLLSFTANTRHGSVELRWKTRDEIDTDHFTVERARNGVDFTPVGRMDAAGQSETGRDLDYSLTDHAPLAGTAYYRLRTTDFDGSYALSPLVAVNYKDAALDFQLSPNPLPTAAGLYLAPTGWEKADDIHLSLYTARGELVYEQSVTTATSRFRVDLPGRLPTGSYFVRLTDATGKQATKMLMIGEGR